MDTKTLNELAFYRIRETIAGRCASAEGKAQLLTREPLTDSSQIEELKTLSREWDAYLQSTRAPALNGWNEIKPFLRLIKTEGSTLEQEQGYTLALFCKSVTHVSEAISSASGTIPLEHLASLTATLPVSDIAQAASLIDRV